MDQLSARGRSNVMEIMSRVPKNLLQDDENISDGNDQINLSMAENWLVRNEVLEICKNAISHIFGKEVKISIELCRVGRD